MKYEFFPAFKNKKFAVWIHFLFLVQNIISVLLGGEKCLRCSKKTLRIPMCRNCLPKLYEAVSSGYCKKCGRKLLSENEICYYCKEEPVLKSTAGSYSLHDYQFWKKSLLFAWKIENKRNLSIYFAALLYKKLKELEKILQTELAVVPVPPRKGKIKERGWDQIDEVCYYLKKAWNVKILYLLERFSKIQQKKLDRIQRFENVQSSYKAKSENKLKKIKKMLPEKVVLIDDVFTTGSTIEACALELKRLGIKSVYSLTLFIVD